MPPFTAQTPDGFDRWQVINSGKTVKDIADLAQLFGVDAVNLPKRKFVARGLMGVALLEDYCVLGFEDGGSQAGKALSSP